MTTWSVFTSLLCVVLLVVVPTEAIKQRWAPRHSAESLKTLLRKPAVPVDSHIDVHRVAPNVSKAVVPSKAATQADELGTFTSFDVELDSCGDRCFPFPNGHYKWGVTSDEGEGFNPLLPTYKAHNFFNGTIAIELEHWFEIGYGSSAINVTLNFGNTWMAIYISKCKLKISTEKEEACNSVSLNPGCEYLLWAWITNDGDSFKIKYEIRKAWTGCLVKCGFKCIKGNCDTLNDEAEVGFDVVGCAKLYRAALQYNHKCPCTENNSAGSSLRMLGGKAKAASVAVNWMTMASDPDDNEEEIDAREAQLQAENAAQDAVLTM